MREMLLLDVPHRQVVFTIPNLTSICRREYQFFARRVAVFTLIGT